MTSLFSTYFFHSKSFRLAVVMLPLFTASASVAAADVQSLFLFPIHNTRGSRTHYVSCRRSHFCCYDYCLLDYLIGVCMGFYAPNVFFCVEHFSAHCSHFFSLSIHFLAHSYFIFSSFLVFTWFSLNHFGDSHHIIR